MKSITPACGHKSLPAHATRHLFYFLYECLCTHFIICVCVVLQIDIVFNRGAPNKAVKERKKKEAGVNTKQPC